MSAPHRRPITSVPLWWMTEANTFFCTRILVQPNLKVKAPPSVPNLVLEFCRKLFKEKILKKQTTLLSLLILAIAATVGCGDSTSVPRFTKVALLSNRTVTPATSLFTANLDGSNITPIPFATTNVWSLSTSADAKTVAFVAYNSGYQLWVSKADGTGQLQLTTPGSPYWARISPNGKKIVYRDSTEHVLVINSDGTGNLDLTATPPTGMTQCYDGSFSADSTKIVFTCYGGSVGYGIYTVKVDGTGLKTVETRSTSNWADYAWFTPDGNKIVFVGNFSNGQGVGSVNIDGTGETLLVPNADELIILNSTMYYDNTCSSPIQIFKANLDGTSPVQVSDSSNNEDLFYPGGGC
jgi:Tol biopolymer transport system component